jgi:NADPH2:quinone reductase
MQAVRYHEHGGVEVLGVEEIQRPTPGHGEVLVEVEAASVNPVDAKFREGGTFTPGGLPWTPGSDAAGLVAETGSGVTEFAEGDRVFATGLGSTRQGTCAEYVAVPTDLLARLPREVGMETAGATALVGVTAWQSLIDAAGLRPAETCLVHGGSGGVGHVAVQLASIAGAAVTTTASSGYHDRLRELGADSVFDYRRGDLERAVTEAGAPDVILDHRYDEYLPFDTRVAAENGRVAIIGNQSPEATHDDVPRCRGKGLSMHHVSMFNTPDTSGVLADLAGLMADRDFGAVVARRYSLDDVTEAHRAVLEDSYLGKLVVVP